MEKRKEDKRTVYFDRCEPPRWMNWFNLGWSSDHVAINALMRCKSRQKVQAFMSISMPLFTAKQLHETLGEVLEAYEKRYGPIEKEAGRM